MAQKQLSNPFSTGSGGPIFETRVQAALASLMLTKGVCPSLPSWPIYKIKLQGKYSGFETDDVIVFAKDDSSNREARLIAQIKHAPSITKIDPQFTDVIMSAWLDFNNPEVFTEGYDAIALITGPLTSSDTYDVREMLELARSAQDSTDFFEKIELAKFSSVGKQKKLKVFRHQLKNANGGIDPDSETTWKFLRNFHLLGYDLDIKAGVSLSLLQSLIGLASPDDAEKVWLKILNEVQSWNPRAGVMTLKSLPKELLDHFRVIVPPRMPIVAATPIRETIAAALIGAWDENCTGDQAAIEAFTGMSFTQWQDKIRDVWLNFPGTFDQMNGRWKVIDRISFWNQEAPRISDSLLEKFRSLAVTVLQEDDPALDLDPDERFAAGIYGKERIYSSLIRKGVSETLALITTNHQALSTCSSGKARGVAEITVTEVLSSNDWKRWASINDIIPVLAEAAPHSFLKAVQNAAIAETGFFANVFAQEGEGVMGRTYITGVLWGLEILAWNTEHLVTVCRILADLATIDPGGNWSNRPSKSLTSILLPWLPQTFAPTETRRAAVKVVTTRSDIVGWKLVCSLLPKPHAISSGTHKPVWQKDDTADYRKRPDHSQYWEDILHYSNMALQLAGNDVSRLASLISSYFNLPDEARQLLCEKLISCDIQSLNQELRFELWQALNQLTTNHRKFADSENWKVPEGSLEKLDVIADLLCPTAPEVKHKRLFSGDDFNLYEEKDNFDEQEAKLAERRKDAVLEILTTGGIELLVKFAKDVCEPWRVGASLGVIGNPQLDKWILPNLLMSDEKALTQFSGGYVWERHRSSGWTWVDSLSLLDWPVAKRGQFFTFLPFCDETWKRVVSSMAPDESSYWQNTSANPFEATIGLDDALKKLISYDRPDAAIHCMRLMLHKSMSLPPDVAVSALAALRSKHRMDAYSIGVVLSNLQEKFPEKENEIRVVEWRLMPFLGRFNNGQPEFLARWLAEDPNFFSEVIQSLYRSKNSEDEEIEVSEADQARAHTAYQLLDEWELPPGTLRDGTFSAQALNAWVSSVKMQCMDSGHWEVASSEIGQVLRHAPVDEEDLWVEPVCTILDQDGNDRMRSGLTMEIFNGRGSYTPDGGKWETAAAEHWEKVAIRAENKGHSQLAQELRRLAISYRTDAARESKRNSLNSNIS